MAAMATGRELLMARRFLILSALLAVTACTQPGTAVLTNGAVAQDD